MDDNINEKLHFSRFESNPHAWLQIEKVAKEDLKFYEDVWICCRFYWLSRLLERDQKISTRAKTIKCLIFCKIYFGKFYSKFKNIHIW
jgi:hypothetical protein